MVVKRNLPIPPVFSSKIPNEVGINFVKSIITNIIIVISNTFDK